MDYTGQQLSPLARALLTLDLLVSCTVVLSTIVVGGLWLWGAL